MLARWRYAPRITNKTRRQDDTKHFFDCEASAYGSVTEWHDQADHREHELTREDIEQFSAPLPLGMDFVVTFLVAQVWQVVAAL